MKVEDIESFQLKLAAPDEILEWSHGEVTEAETLNYRTQKPEKDGLFCERIFGPSKDYKCYCGKYKGARYKGVVCDRCGVEVTKSSVRRERMGHIDLATPVSHIWFLKGVPSKMGAVLNISANKLEKVVYFANYIITDVEQEVKEETGGKIEKEYQSKVKALESGLEASEEQEQDEQEQEQEDEEDKGQEQEKLTEEEFESKKKKLNQARDEALEDLNDLYQFRILTEVEYYHLSLKYGEVFDAGTGAEALKKLFEKVDLDQEIEEVRAQIEEKSGSTKKLERRLQILQGMKDADIKPEWMFLEVLPVTPPGIRPLVQLDGGRFASSDLNDLYRRVINRNNRLKHLLDIGAPQVIVRNEKRMLQEAVDALIDNGMRKRKMVRSSTGGRRELKSLSDVLSGKQGRFRRNLLGKRVDYSGRSVIAVDPTLKISQCGLPKELGLELFKPFIIQRLLKKEQAYNVRGATEHIEKKTDQAWEALEEVVEKKVVLLNRAPTLHRLGIQAFEPVLVEGKAIKIHPMVCPAYNADFDGDQMAIHIPLTEEAQQEAKNRMLSSKNLLKPATGLPIAVPAQDYILGTYYLTTNEQGAKGEGQIFSSVKQAKLAYEFDKIDLRAEIKVRVPDMNIENQELETDNVIETTVGRLIFNEVLPDDFPYQNEQIDSGRMNSIISKAFERYDVDQADFLDALKDLGKEYSTWSGVTWGIDDLKIPEKKKKIIEEGMEREKEIDQQLEKGLLTEEERREQLIEIWQQAKTKIEKIVPEALSEDNPVYEMVNSGARGSWGPVVQMMGMKGLVVNPAGEIIELPVRSSFKEGFDVLEYFISTHGSRKGAADGALRTAKAGYLTRRLVDVAQQVLIREENCGTDQGLVMNKKEAEAINQDFDLKIVGRIVLEDVEDEDEIIVEKGDLIDWGKAERIIKSDVEQVKVRSPLTCESKRGVCRQCYGWHPGDNERVEMGAAVGIVAAQAIGEPGTQLTLRTFHTGGVAGESDITSGLPRAEELFEVRDPKGEAPLTKVNGEVVKVEDRTVQIEPEDKEAEIVEYELPPKRGIWVKKGQQIKAGDQLCEGSLNLEELFEAAGERKTWRYILKETQKVYSGQGADIHDKHLEVILRQMFSRVKVTDPHGSTGFVTGEVIERAQYLEEKAALEQENKEPLEVESILQGITKVSLSTESLLSAASFQRTSQVLIDAAIKGEKDVLRGLKENVMIGKKIPAGTGYEEE